MTKEQYLQRINDLTSRIKTLQYRMSNLTKDYLAQSDLQPGDKISLKYKEGNDEKEGIFYVHEIEEPFNKQSFDYVIRISHPKNDGTKRTNMDWSAPRQYNWISYTIIEKAPQS